MQKTKEKSVSISKQALKRLPVYHHYLKKLSCDGMVSIAAPKIAKELQLNEVQVRKDLAAVSHSGGRPRTGFDLLELISSIEHYLGYDNINEAVLVGAGKLGKALLAYQGFEQYGVKIVAAFDHGIKNPAGVKVDGGTVFPLSMLEDLCRRLNIHIGIITVPADCAQEICDMLVKSGILAIWNFAPVHLNVPNQIVVQNENMAASLALLSKHLKDQPSTNK